MIEIEGLLDTASSLALGRQPSLTTHPMLLSAEMIEYICQENADITHLIGK